jgi:hypothetical protein
MSGETILPRDVPPEREYAKKEAGQSDDLPDNAKNKWTSTAPTPEPEREWTALQTLDSPRYNRPTSALRSEATGTGT